MFLNQTPIFISILFLIAFIFPVFIIVNLVKTTVEANKRTNRNTPTMGAFIGNIIIKEKQIPSDLSVSGNILITDNKTIDGRVNSLEEATEIAKASPVLKMGDTVEVRNIIFMEN